MTDKLTAEERFKLRQWLDGEESLAFRKVLDSLADFMRERAATELEDVRFLQGIYRGVQLVRETLESAARPPVEPKDSAASITSVPRRHATGGYM